MRLLVLSLAAVNLMSAAENTWMVNPAAASANPALRAALPNVQNVRRDSQFIYVESAGLSLHSLGALEAGGWEPAQGLRKFVFRLPLAPRPAVAPTRTPLGVTGVFLNGVPFFNPASPVSWQDQNLWHRDAVALSQGASPLASPLLDALLNTPNRHSPLLGFALDGFPVYGPFGWDEHGQTRRFRSGYQLRAMAQRTRLPDGTVLTPSQEGPPVTPEYPPGTFVEDYDFVAGAGDLDQHNGRLTRTPEFPDGTYAYFLSTNPQAAMAYPYLLGASYYGEVPTPAGSPEVMYAPLDAQPIELSASPAPEAGHPVTLRLSIRDGNAQRIRFLEKIHEQPIHLIVVSTDLAEFAHIHPSIQADDTYVVTHTFAHRGSYWLFADYTPPGGTQTISRFRVDVRGLHPATPPTLPRTEPALPVKLTLPPELRAGQDLTFRFDLPGNDLEPYLGAWAHFVIISADRKVFIHAHPLDEANAANAAQHSHALSGPSPSVITTITGFQKPGIYKLWAQFQRQGSVITIPYTLNVLPATKHAGVKTPWPTDAIPVNVSSKGFSPARITLSAGKTTRLAFRREDAQSCANSIVFPELGIRRALPLSQTVVIEIPASSPGELHFSCGMNMYRGALLISTSTTR